MAGPVGFHTMTLQRRSIGFLLMTAAASLVLVPAIARLTAQEQPPNRREFTISARDYKFTPGRIEVTQDDLVKLTVLVNSEPGDALSMLVHRHAAEARGRQMCESSRS